MAYDPIYAKEYRLKTKDKAAAYDAKYQIKNRTKIHKYKRYYYKENKINWRYNLLKKYGLTVEQFNALRRKQKYGCAICKIHETKIRNQQLHVDHCHKTGKVRGLLCTKCNSAIGLFRDSPKLLKRAISYLLDKKV